MGVRSQRHGDGGGTLAGKRAVPAGSWVGYCLSGAGGFTRLAEKGAVSVRYANGEVRTRRKSLFFSSNPTPLPGSEVFVPARDPNEAKTDYVSLFGAIAQILASTVAIIVVVTR